MLNEVTMSPISRNGLPHARLYSLWQIVGATFFGGLLAAAVLLFQSYVALGRPRLARLILASGVLLMLCVIAAGFLLPWGFSPLYIPTALALGVYLALRKVYVREYLAYRSRGGVKKSIWAVVMIVALCSVSTVAVASLFLALRRGAGL